MEEPSDVTDDVTVSNRVNLFDPVVKVGPCWVGPKLLRGLRADK